MKRRIAKKLRKAKLLREFKKADRSKGHLPKGLRAKFREMRDIFLLEYGASYSQSEMPRKGLYNDLEEEDI